MDVYIGLLEGSEVRVFVIVAGVEAARWHGMGYERNETSPTAKMSRAPNSTAALHFCGY